MSPQATDRLKQSQIIDTRVTIPNKDFVTKESSIDLNAAVSVQILHL